MNIKFLADTTYLKDYYFNKIITDLKSLGLSSNYIKGIYKRLDTLKKLLIPANSTINNKQKAFLNYINHTPTDDSDKIDYLKSFIKDVVEDYWNFKPLKPLIVTLEKETQNNPFFIDYFRKQSRFIIYKPLLDLPPIFHILAILRCCSMSICIEGFCNNISCNINNKYLGYDNYEKNDYAIIKQELNQTKTLPIELDIDYRNSIMLTEAYAIQYGFQIAFNKYLQENNILISTTVNNSSWDNAKKYLLQKNSFTFKTEAFINHSAESTTLKQSIDENYLDSLNYIEINLKNKKDNEQILNILNTWVEEAKKYQDNNLLINNIFNIYDYIRLDCEKLIKDIANQTKKIYVIKDNNSIIGLVIIWYDINNSIHIDTLKSPREIISFYDIFDIWIYSIFLIKKLPIFNPNTVENKDVIFYLSYFTEKLSNAYGCNHLFNSFLEFCNKVKS